jgi:hypothetical protein
MPAADAAPISVTRPVFGNASLVITHDPGCRTVTVEGLNFNTGDTVVVSLYAGGSFYGDPTWAPYLYAYPRAIDIGTLHGYFAVGLDVSGMTSVAPGAKFLAYAQDGYTVSSSILSCS